MEEVVSEVVDIIIIISITFITFIIIIIINIDQTEDWGSESKLRALIFGPFLW